MTTGLTYTSYQSQIATMAAIASTSDTNFQTILPSMIDYAELRIFRDLDILATITTGTQTATVGTRQITFQQFVTIQQLNLITPSTTTTPDLGTRNPMTPTTKEYLDNVYPDSSSAGPPGFFAPFSQANTGTTISGQTINTVLVGPFPDQTYTVEIIGTYRPPSLSSTNATTFISQNMPDLFIMASMIYISAFQRNFGRLNDDPSMAITYESQYQALLKGATVEEFRKKFESSGWTAMSPSPVASPTRG